jgi:hypothetical protein
MRFDLLNEDILKGFHEAGCKNLQISIESADYQTRKNLLKRDMSDEVIRNGIELCKKYQINVLVNFMIGLPDVPHEYDVKAVTFSCQHNLGYVDFPIYQPYPKTDIGELCIKNNWFDGNFNKIHLSYGHHSVLTCFSLYRKIIMRNLAILGTVASLYPKSRWIILNILIYLPLYQVYFLIFYLSKMSFHINTVYKYKHSFWEIIRLISKSFTVEYIKRK